MLTVCVFCKKAMDPALDDWSTFQPYAGGEVQFIFSYGSTKFDLSYESTIFRGLVCDECAEKYVASMDKLG